MLIASLVAATDSSSQAAPPTQPDRRLVYSDQDTLNYNQGVRYRLPAGKVVTVSVTSNTPIDVFVLTEDGVESYKKMLRGKRGRATTYEAQKSTRSAEFTWKSPDNRSYFLVLDNSSFVDGGAIPTGRAVFTVRFWQVVPRLAEPSRGLGLLIGRVSLQYDGYKGRNETYSGPLTVHLAHKADDDDDEEETTFQISTSPAGFFAVGNLLMNRSYRFAKIEGRNFSVEIPSTITAFSRLAITIGEDDRVYDVGHLAVTVKSDGKLAYKMISPKATVEAGAGHEGITLGFESESPFGRHRWFALAHRQSGWASIVKADRRKIEEEEKSDEATAKADKSAEATESTTDKAAAPNPADSGKQISSTGTRPDSN
jgi:hypothetical protein